MTWRTFFDAVIMAKVKRRSLLLQRHRLSRRGVNATGERFAGRPLRVREPFEERPFRLGILNPAADPDETLNGSRLSLYILGRGPGDGPLLRFLPPP
jgi:hypothetical protein